MLIQAFTTHFSADRIDAWNRLELDALLAHYADHFEMRSRGCRTCNSR